MSQNASATVDFELPGELLAVIPTDPYQQLDLARRITSMAIASRVSMLEAEASRLRHKVHDKDRIIVDLEEKLSRLQRALQLTESRLQLSLDDNMKLSKERDSLATTAKKLSLDLSKLETFKRQLMQSLSEDSVSQTETIDIETCDQPVLRGIHDQGREATDYASHHALKGSADAGNVLDEFSKQVGRRHSITPYITPRLTPTGTPKIISTTGSPRGYAVSATPNRISGTTSPAKVPYDGRTALSSWYPSSQQSSAANSPPCGRSLPGRTPRIDGKEFFRQARTRLSYEQFSAFLVNIKGLNAQKQTREETLRKAEDIFGTDKKDLYLSFEGLLNRNLH